MIKTDVLVDQELNKVYYVSAFQATQSRYTDFSAKKEKMLL